MIFDTAEADDERLVVAVRDTVAVRVEVGVELALADGVADVGSSELFSLRFGVAVLGWAVRAGIAVRWLPRFTRR